VFNLWLGELLWEDKSANVFRIKGVVAVKGENKKYALQAVHSLFEVEACEVEWEEGAARETKLVFIGRNLDAERLKTSLLKEL